WELHFDESSTLEGRGARIVLVSPIGDTIQLSYKSDFGCSNNEAEYETLIHGLLVASTMGDTSLNIKGDYRLVLSQVMGEYGVKEPTLASYRMWYKHWQVAFRRSNTITHHEAPIVMLTLLPPWPQRLMWA
ncbi:RVT_3 domain-containing protein, partial [Cephalotus follicularis]